MTCHIEAAIEFADHRSSVPDLDRPGRMKRSETFSLPFNVPPAMIFGRSWIDWDRRIDPEEKVTA